MCVGVSALGLFFYVNIKEKLWTAVVSFSLALWDVPATQTSFILFITKNNHRSRVCFIKSCPWSVSLMMFCQLSYQNSGLINEHVWRGLCMDDSKGFGRCEPKRGTDRLVAEDEGFLDRLDEYWGSIKYSDSDSDEWTSQNEEDIQSCQTGNRCQEKQDNRSD